MTQVYTKLQINKSTKFENNQKKESLDALEDDVSLEEVKKYRGHRRVIPAHIVDDFTLKEAQKSLYALLDDLSHHPDHFGYCFASNGLLCKIMNMKLRCLQRNLEILHKKGLIIIEISQKFRHKSIRKIWTLDQFAIRERLEKIYGEDKFNQRFYTHVKNDMSSCQKRHTDIDSNILPSISIDKEVVYKSPKNTPPPTSASTTAFSKKKKKDNIQKEQKWLTEDQRSNLKTHWGKIGEAVIEDIDALMKRDSGAYTNKEPFDDAKKFCIERTEKKSKRFRKEPQISQEEIEEKNIEEINNLLTIYKPGEKIFRALAKSKTVEIFNSVTNLYDVLDYTKEDFKENMWKLYHPHYLKNRRKG